MARSNKTGVASRLVLVLLLWAAGGQCVARDLEPRRWTHLPVGLNVLGVGGGKTEGDIFFDPVLLIEDATFELYGFGASYVRSFDWFGKTGRIDVTVPYAVGRWEGLLDGVYASVRRSGLADPRVRFSINLYGAPAMRGAEFLQYRKERPVNTTVGAAIAVNVPLGQYSSDYLINLGSNRWVIRPQLGVLHQRYNWQFELSGSVFLFQDNDEFWLGAQLEQDPLWFTQGHVIYTFRPGWWASLSGGIGLGAEATVNGVRKNNDERSSYWALSLGLPLSARQAMKLTWFSVESHVRSGVDTDALLLAWSVNWSR